MRFAIAVSLAIALPVPSIVQAQAAATDLSPASKQSALALINTLYPQEMQMRMADRIVDESMAPAFRKDENFAALEADYPGILNAVLDALRPLLRDYIKAGLPSYYDRVAVLFAGRLTAAEIDDLAGFYRTPTGQKLLKAMIDNYRIDATMAEVVANPDAPTSLVAITRDHQAAVASAQDAVDDTDSEALIALAKKPYVNKILELGLEMRKLDQQIMNEPDPALDKKVEGVVADVLDRFIAAADAKAGAKK